MIHLVELVSYNENYETAKTRLTYVSFTITFEELI